MPSFGKHSLIMLTYCNVPKIGIKFLKIYHVRILFLASVLLFVAVINPYSVFKILILVCLLFVYTYIST